MTKTVIPQTDNPTVALIAAALHLAESASGETDSFEQKLARYRKAYQTLLSLMSDGNDVVAILPSLQGPSVPPGFPIGPPGPVYRPLSDETSSHGGAQHHLVE